MQWLRSIFITDSTDYLKKKNIITTIADVMNVSSKAVGLSCVSTTVFHNDNKSFDYPSACESTLKNKGKIVTYNRNYHEEATCGRM